MTKKILILFLIRKEYYQKDPLQTVLFKKVLKNEALYVYCHYTIFIIPWQF